MRKVQNVSAGDQYVGQVLQVGRGQTPQWEGLTQETVNAFINSLENFAAQVCLHMVYAGINTLVALGHLPQKSTETANFLKQVNSIFYFLNVRGSRYSKKPLKGDEADQIQIANLRRQAQTWKVQNNRSRPPNFLALDQKLHAVELLSRDLVQKGVFPHLLTGRFNQDCLAFFHKFGPRVDTDSTHLQRNSPMHTGH